ncbi:MAG TPA: cytochrome P450 [Stellaceae bacterium]|nr:cytochrome P450 [Stellaceae bacterium]
MTAPASAWPDDPAAMRETAFAFDLKRLERRFLDDPYPLYRALREHDPVHLMPDGSWFLSRYEDCAAVYRDADTWSSDKTVDFRPNFGDSLLYEHHTTSLVFNDPPYHTRVRRLLAPAFTPRALRTLQPRVEALVDRLLDDLAARRRFDLIEDFASAIPVQLIGDMLGVPEEERGPLRGWSLAILGALEPVLSPEQRSRGIAAVAEFKTYLADLVERRHADPRPETGEILSTLVAASEFAGSEGAGERLTGLELLHNCIFLLNAGHETTTNLIGNGIDLLLRHPGAWAELRREPALVESAVEEFLRLESSNQLGNRRARRDTVLAGTTMHAGSYVHIGIGAANRDPAQFADPERLDLRRHPNRHLAFATGIHACAGMSLARMEAEVAIGRLVQRFAAVERDGEPVRGGRARFRGFLRYPLRAEGGGR